MQNVRINELINKLKDNDWRVRERAVRDLGDIDETKIFPILLVALKVTIQVDQGTKKVQLSGKAPQ